jgi:hypothetical protein
MEEQSTGFALEHDTVPFHVVGVSGVRHWWTAFCGILSVELTTFFFRSALLLRSVFEATRTATALAVVPSLSQIFDAAG